MYFAVSNIKQEIVKWILYTQFVKLNIFWSHSINLIGCMTSLFKWMSGITRDFIGDTIVAAQQEGVVSDIINPLKVTAMYTTSTTWQRNGNYVLATIKYLSLLPTHHLWRSMRWSISSVDTLSVSMHIACRDTSSFHASPLSISWLIDTSSFHTSYICISSVLAFNACRYFIFHCITCIDSLTSIHRLCIHRNSSVLTYNFFRCIVFIQITALVNCLAVLTRSRSL